MYSIKNLLSKNPIQISGVIVLALNFFIVMHWLPTMTVEQLGILNSLLVAALGLFVVQTTTNTAKLNEMLAVSNIVAEDPAAKQKTEGPSPTNFDIPDGS